MPKDEAGIEDAGSCAAGSAGPGAAAADPPAGPGTAVAAPPSAGRSLQLRLMLPDQTPAQPERLRDGVVRRLKADAD
jgi:hypothetical protein